MPISGVCADSLGLCPSWDSFRQCSGSPLLVHPETMVSCLFSRPTPFPGLPPSYLWYISPLQAVFTQPTPALYLGCDLQRPSLCSQPPSLLAGSSADKPLGLVSAGWHQLSVQESLHYALCTPPYCYTLLRVSEASPMPPPVSASEGAS